MADGQPLPRLSAAEAAARLGVKPETLYAYVSRGLLTRERTAAGSTFDPLEVEGFARRRRPSRPAAPQDGRMPAGTPLMVLDTDVAVIEDGELYYRGRPAAVLATEADLEAVAAWLWSGVDPGTAAPVAGVVGDDDARAVRHLVAALPSSATLLDRIQAAVTGLAATDPLRHDTDAESLRRVGARLLTGVPRALAGAVARPVPAAVGRLGDVLAAGPGGDAVVGGGGGRHAGTGGPSVTTGAGPAAATGRGPRGGTGGGSDVGGGTARTGVAATLWRALSTAAPTPEGVHALSAALVLTVDHDLAVSTLAARVAASARASGYAVVTAALGAFDSALHGNASRAAAGLLARVLAGERVEAALAAVVRDGRGVPGFGHPLYTGMDARARALLPLVAALPEGGRVLAAVEAVAAEVARRAGLHPNLDLALAALVLAAGMSHEAGTAVFAVGRTVGWIAHALAEHEERPLRLRPRGRYTGP